MQEVDINAPSEIPLPKEALDAPVILDAEPETEIQAKQTYVPEHRSHIAPIRTFSSDLADAIKTQGGSVVRIAIAEDEKRRKEKAEASLGSKKNIAFVLASIIVVIGAIALVVFEYRNKQTAGTVAPVVVSQPSSIITAEASQTIDATGMQAADLIGAVNTIVAAPGIQQGMIKNIVITQASGGSAVRIPANTFLGIIAPHAPSSFLGALNPAYMLGVYAYGKNAPFLIVAGTAHDFLQSGMLAWEPNLFEDMVPLFGLDATTMAPGNIQNAKFTDTIISNHDTRAVLDANGNPVFFYSFLDPNTVIFAADPKALTEVVSRFQ